MATAALPDWDADSPRLRRNLASISGRILRDAQVRVIPSVTTAKAWHRRSMSGLAVPKQEYVGAFRGEPGLERCGVEIDGKPGTMPWDVADELAAFEASLLGAVSALDAKYPDAASLDDDGMRAAIVLAAWAHSEWVRIHPFVNGNGRTARIWANLLLMRYGLPPAVALCPRPGGEYGAAGAAAMSGDRVPTIKILGELVKSAVSALPAGKKGKPL